MESEQQSAIESFRREIAHATMLLGSDERGDAFVALETGKIVAFDAAGAHREVTNSEGMELLKMISVAPFQPL